MKIYNYFFLFVAVLVTGCSSSDDDGVQKQDLTAEMTLSVNGQAIDMSHVKYAYRDFHTISLGNDDINSGSDFFISFDENGNFGKISYVYYEPLAGVRKKFSSAADFSSNYFNFNLAGYDTVGKRVKVTFDGYIFYDPLNLNSESKFISGSFSLPIEDYVPTVVNRINEATINGNYWRATNSYQKRNGQGPNFYNISLYTMSDDPYRITITFNNSYDEPTIPGTTYNFTPSSLKNKVHVAKYDVATSSYILYDCTGTFTMQAMWGNYCVEGTYNFTGVNPANPSDVINVQNGKFKMIYKQFAN